jgi:hypothetical protein
VLDRDAWVAARDALAEARAVSFEVRFLFAMVSWDSVLERDVWSDVMFPLAVVS